MFCSREVFQTVLACFLYISSSGYYVLVCYATHCFGHSVSISVGRQLVFCWKECISHFLCSLFLSGTKSFC